MVIYLTIPFYLKINIESHKTHCAANTLKVTSTPEITYINLFTVCLPNRLLKTIYQSHSYDLPWSQKEAKTKALF